jgi:hypothetical protein
MSGRDDESFEERVRAIASGLSRSVERFAKQLDLDEIAEEIATSGERFRELADGAGRWMTDRLGAPDANQAARSAHADPDSAERSVTPAGPHRLDVPTDVQRRALSALSSGRWKVDPGTDDLIAIGEAASPAFSVGLVGELRARDWIAATGELTSVGRDALRRWSQGAKLS